MQHYVSMITVNCVLNLNAANRRASKRTRRTRSARMRRRWRWRCSIIRSTISNTGNPEPLLFLVHRALRRTRRTRSAERRARWCRQWKTMQISLRAMRLMMSRYTAGLRGGRGGRGVPGDAGAVLSHDGCFSGISTAAHPRCAMPRASRRTRQMLSAGRRRHWRWRCRRRPSRMSSPSRRPPPAPPSPPPPPPLLLP